MKNKKIVNFVYDGLGFPIFLINAPRKFVFGEWVLDINFNKLQLVALKSLAHKPTPLNEKELTFIRKYFEMNKSEFGKLLGVSHVAVVKWENGGSINPTTDAFIKLYISNNINMKDKEFRETYNEILENLAKGKKVKIERLEINVKENLLIA